MSGEILEPAQTSEDAASCPLDAQLRRLVETIPDVIYRYRLSSPRGMEYISPAIESLLGYSPSEFYAKPDLALDVLHPDERRKAFDPVGAVILAERPFEMQWQHKDGRRVWVEVRYEVEHDPAGHPIAMQGVVRDLSERRRLEAELHQARALMNNTLTGLRDGALIIEMNGRIRECNSATLQALGLSREMLVNKTLFDLHENIPAFPQLYAHAQSSANWQHISHPVLASIQRKDGSHVEIEFTFSPIQDVLGQQAGWLCLLRDVSIRRQMEQDLRYTNDLLEQVLSNLDQAVFVLDLSSGRILRSNQMAENLFGYTTRELVGMDPRQLHMDHEAYQQHLRDALQAIANKTTHHAEHLLRRRDGREFAAEVTCSLIQDKQSRYSFLVCVVRDISTHKQIEAALRASEERYRGIVEYSPLPIYIQCEGRIAYINPAGVGLLGAHTPGELIGQPILNLVPSSQRTPHTQRAIVADEELRMAVPIERQYRRLDGNLIDVEVTATPFTFRGKPAAHVMVRDITSQKVAEHAHQEAEHRYTSLFLNTYVAMLLINPVSGQIVEANPAACTFYGYTREQILQMSTFDLFAQDEDLTSSDMLQALTGECQHFVMQHRLVNGQLRDVEVFGSSVAVSNRNFLFANLYDITERRRTEAALLETNARLRALYASSPLPIIATDALGRVEIWNPAAERVLGWSFQQVQGRIPPFLQEQEFLEILDRLSHSRHERPHSHREFWCSRRDGSRRLVNWWITPVFDKDGQLNGTIGILVDITEQKKVETALREERERLARELHDSVTQSLYSLTLFAEAAQQQLIAGQQDMIPRFIGRIGDTALQALKEMRLLVYQLRPSALEGTGLVEAIEQRLNAVERRAGVSACLLADDIPPLPFELENQLYRVAQEALNNCLKHSAATAISVRLRLIEHNLEFTIQDNGNGFVVEQAKHAGGMGLLNIQQRVEGLGGTLQIESTLGEGTQLVAQIPMILPTNALASKTSPPATHVMDRSQNQKIEERECP